VNNREGESERLRVREREKERFKDVSLQELKEVIERKVAFS
jgi:hypothetical protein